MQTHCDVSPVSLRRTIFPKVIVLACLAGVSATVNAATVGHWRFENASNLGLDSSPNGLDLNLGSATASSTVASNPIPRLNSANTGSADFELSSTNYLALGDQPALAVQSFTIEAYIRLESAGSGSTGRVIASQLNTGTGASAAWQFGISGSGSGLGATRPFLQLSANGSDLYGISPEPSVSASAFTISTGVHYYLAATVDFSGNGFATKFYLQNITAGGSLISMDGTVSFPADVTALPAGLFNSTANFAIGTSYANGSPGTTRYFDGLIDEVRLSDSVLTQDQLLAVPEPASLLMAGAASAIIGLGRRRR